MSFESGSLGFRIFHLPRPLPEDAAALFAANAAPMISSTQEGPSFGWVTGRHLLDRDIREETAVLGGYLRLDLLQAEFKIPASLLRAELKQEELARLAASGQEFIGRKEKSEIKAQITERLLPQMPPQLKGLSLVCGMRSQVLFAAALSETQCDLFTIHFRHSAGFNPLPLTPENAAMQRWQTDAQQWAPVCYAPDVEPQFVSALAGHDFLTWLWFRTETDEGLIEVENHGRLGVLIEGPLTFVMEGSGAHETVLRKGSPTLSPEAKASLLSGKKLSKAKVTLANDDEIWSAMVDAGEFVFRSVKLPDAEEGLDPISRFQDRMFKLEQFQELFLGLYDQFVKLRRSKAAWSDTVEAMRGWMANKKTVA